MNIQFESIERFIKSVFGEDAKLISIEGIEVKGDSLKGYGYGKPLIINFEIKGIQRKAVLETLKEDIFGHEYKSDRFQSLIWAYEAYNKLPRHAKALAMGYFDKNGRLIPMKDFDEPFILVDFIKGTLYYLDLERIREHSELSDIDIKRCLALSEYLVNIHSKKAENKRIYIRRIRELLGHGECIMGLIDSYPEKSDFYEEDFFPKLEKKLIDWRWKLKNFTHRASQIHGDFHPWNIFFIGDSDFIVNDRSRGDYGEPGDDVTALTINYLFFSLQKWNKLQGPFEFLFKKFFENYIEKSNDEELLKVLQPFYAWRSLVIASPIWYPNLKYETRKAIFNFMKNILDVDVFDYKSVNSLLS